MLQIGCPLHQQRLRLLRLLHAARASVCEVAVAPLVLRREARRRLSRGKLRRRPLDHRLLQLQLRADIADLVLSARSVGNGLIQCGSQVAIVDLRQHLPGFDRLVVADQHLGNVAGNPRRDDHGIGLDIGIVRRHLKPADLPVLHAERSHQTDAYCPGQGGQGALPGHQTTAADAVRDNAAGMFHHATHGFASLLNGSAGLPFGE